MIRVVLPGHKPKNLRLCSFDMSVGAVLELGGVGGGKVPDGHTAAINGRMASTDDRVKAGDTVQMQPRATNG